ncbi:probable acyl-CoA dehydrogenase protein [Sagittula stellata E-37]|uniref:Probable acyl-CoA dehydrogenase protein n=1 Tax=Sagittula stellata (strain ATCC 700073 / DSM 11524 / E-37) TaxID=388399 RepID=A3JZV3_SAGS3|nr:probable acyl-CoA dehydrogenase protein [Sagittula stellata E-37]
MDRKGDFIDFGPSDEQDMIVSTVRAFVEKEIYPHEAEVERTGEVPPGLGEKLRRKVIDLGFYACNFPEAGSDVRGMRCTAVRDGATGLSMARSTSSLARITPISLSFL